MASWSLSDHTMKLSMNSQIRRGRPYGTFSLTPFPCRGFQNASRVESGAQQRFARPQQVLSLIHI
eukprot:4278794-Prymnesium_polylepis.1